MRIASILVASAALVAAPAATASPQPLHQLVLHPGDLPGWAIPARTTVQGPAAFAKTHDKTPAEIRRTGFVEGATLMLGGRGMGLSIAVRYGTTAQARHEALRLYRSNLQVDPGMSAAPFSVAGIPGSRAIRMAGMHDKKPVKGYEIVFSNGTDMIELFVIGLAKDIDEGAVVKAARTLWRRSNAS